MANIDINAWIILITLFVIYGVFLCFDLFQRNEKYGFFAYIVAIIPANFMWAVGFYIILVYIVLFSLWIITLFRDLFFVYRKTREYDDILLFLLLGVFIHLIVTAILPETIPTLKTADATGAPFLFFWLPNIFDATVSSSFLLAFRILLTGVIVMAMAPLILDIKGEAIPFPVLIVIVAIFIIPFLILSYVWLPEAVFVLTFLMSVIMFIILLIITRSGKEVK